MTIIYLITPPWKIAITGLGSINLFFENWRKYLEVDPGGLINYFLKGSAQRRMSTEKLFKILKIV